MYVCTCTHILYIKNNILCTTCEASCTHVPGKMHRTKVHVNNTITTQHVPHVMHTYLSVKTQTEYFQGLWAEIEIQQTLMIQGTKKKREDKEEK